MGNSFSISMKDEPLVDLAKEGDERALVDLYEKYMDAIYRFCYWQTNKDREVAEDLTQDIFIEMVKSIRNFRGRGSFKNWLYTIAKRKILKWVRLKYQFPTETLFDNMVRGEDFIDPEKQEEKIKQLEEMLARLSEKEQKVITLRFLQNYSVLETSNTLGITQSSVKVIAHRTLKKLRKWAECNQADTL